MKKEPNLHLISFFLLFFLLHTTLTTSIDSYYQTCQPYTCGNITITYPFYIQGYQQSYCGEPGFDIGCLSNKYPAINLSNHLYNITSISYSEKYIQISDSDFNRSSSFDSTHDDVLLTCRNSIHNLTLEVRKFRYSSNTQSMFLLFNCSQTVLKTLPTQSKINCSNNKTIVALYGEDSGQYEEVKKGCGEMNSVPYMMKDHQEDAEQVLKNGFRLNWSANNCSACQDSGGRCGYTNDTSEFKCFCPDRPHSYSCDHRRSDSKTKWPIILGSVLGVVVLVSAAFILLAFWRCRRIKQDSYSTKPRTLDSDQSDLETGSVFLGVPVFSYDDLKEATDNFNSAKELGEGGFGTVYYGKLKDGREVAVKRLYEKNYKQIEQFMNEIQILTCLHHKNLVTLYGCTSRHSRHLLLVYEFIPRGTLADHLHGDKSEAKSLTWPIRMKIAIETASALSYLHASDIIHRDVKTNNILLDNHFTVKVADFGLCRLFPTDVTHVSTAPQGTPGYVDPEYHQCYHLTSKSDVYSFGVVLIELISSLPAVDIDRHRYEINLSTYAMNRIQCGDIHELIDPSLGFDTDYKVKRMIMLVAELAFQCLQQDREIRPSMDEVLEKLKRIESVDYDLSREEEMERESSTKQQPPSPSEQDDIGLLESVQHLPPSPDSVMKEWVSKSTTPNTSAKEFCS